MRFENGCLLVFHYWFVKEGVERTAADLRRVANRHRHMSSTGETSFLKNVVAQCDTTRYHDYDIVVGDIQKRTLTLAHATRGCCVIPTRESFRHVHRPARESHGAYASKASRPTSGCHHAIAGLKFLVQSGAQGASHQ